MTKKSCDDAITKIYGYLDGEISPMKRVLVRLHLRRCSGCEGAFSFERRLQIVIRERCQEEVPADVLAKLRAIVSDEQTS